MRAAVLLFFALSVVLVLTTSVAVAAPFVVAGIAALAATARW